MLNPCASRHLRVTAAPTCGVPPSPQHSLCAQQQRRATATASLVSGSRHVSFPINIWTVLDIILLNVSAMNANTTLTHFRSVTGADRGLVLAKSGSGSSSISVPMVCLGRGRILYSLSFWYVAFSLSFVLFNPLKSLQAAASVPTSASPKKWRAGVCHH